MGVKDFKPGMVVEVTERITPDMRDEGYRPGLRGVVQPNEGNTFVAALMDTVVEDATALFYPEELRIIGVAPEVEELDAWWVTEGSPVDIELRYDEDQALVELIVDDERAIRLDLLDGSATKGLKVWVQR